MRLIRKEKQNDILTKLAMVYYRNDLDTDDKERIIEIANIVDPVWGSSNVMDLVYSMTECEEGQVCLNQKQYARIAFMKKYARKKTVTTLSKIEWLVAIQILPIFLYCRWSAENSAKSYRGVLGNGD